MYLKGGDTSLSIGSKGVLSSASVEGVGYSNEELGAQMPRSSHSSESSEFWWVRASFHSPIHPHLRNLACQSHQPSRSELAGGCTEGWE